MCIFGASSTWGAWDTEKGGWANRLRLWIDEQNLAADSEDGFYWEVYNLGISGDTTKDVLSRFESEMKARKGNLIIISIGDNDTVYNGAPDKPRLTEDEYASNIEQMISIARAVTDRIVLLGLKKVTEEKVQPVWWDDEVNYSNDSIKAYDERLKKIADEQGVGYIPMFDLLTVDDLEDGLHPNAQGHEKIFQKIKDWLENKKWLEI